MSFSLARNPRETGKRYITTMNVTSSCIYGFHPIRLETSNTNVMKLLRPKKKVLVLLPSPKYLKLLGFVTVLPIQKKVLVLLPSPRYLKLLGFVTVLPIHPIQPLPASVHPIQPLPPPQSTPLPEGRLCKHTTHTHTHTHKPHSILLTGNLYRGMYILYMRSSTSHVSPLYGVLAWAGGHQHRDKKYQEKIWFYWSSSAGEPITIILAN